MTTQPPRDDLASLNTSELFTLLFEKNRHPVWIYDVETLRFLSVNDAAVRRYGYSRPEFLEMTIADIRPPEEVDALLENVARTSAPFDSAGIWRHRTKDGEVLHVDIASQEMTYAGRKARIVRAEDVTERIRAEELLRQAEARYRTLLEHLPAIVYEAPFGLQAPWSYVSPQVEQLLGFSAEEWTSHPNLWRERIHPEDRDRVLAVDRHAERTGSPVVIEYRLLARDGRVVWVHDEARVHHPDDGGDPVLQGIMFDLTPQKTVETALRDSEARLQSFIASLDEIVFEFGPEGEYLNVWSSNEALLARPREELIGRKVRDVVSEELWRPFEEVLERVFSTGEAETFEYPLEVLGGPRWFVARLSLIPSPDGSKKRVAMLARDITDRKRAEEDLKKSFDLLRQTDEERRLLLSRLVRAQEEERRSIAGDIHDDSIQVLTALGLRLDMLSRHLTTTEQRSAIEQLQETLTQAMGRLRNLLFELRPPTLDREGLISALKSNLELMKTESGTHYELVDRLEREPPSQTRSIAYRIAQEALANARKHSGATRIEVEAESRDGGWLVRVTDDGKGFDVDGFQAPPGHLGLTAMRERAEIAGGWCEVESVQGEGTTVRFWLPGEEGGLSPSGRR